MGQEASPHSAVLATYLNDQDEWVRTHTSESLLIMGAPFSPRLDDLVTSMDDDTGDLDMRVSKRGQAMTRRRALQALGQRGAPAAPHAAKVASYCKDEDVGVRRRAAEALARMSVDGEAHAVLPHAEQLKSCLRHDNALLRTSAVEALLQMGPAAEPHAATLAHCLLDSDADVRRKAAEALGRIGPAAAPHIKKLSTILHDSDPGCRRCAAESMLQMGAAAAPFANELAGLLDDSAVGMRWTLLEGLKGLGQEGADALAFRTEGGTALMREIASSTLDDMGLRSPTARNPGRSLGIAAADILRSPR